MHMFYRILVDRIGIIVSMFHFSAFVITIDNADLSTISVTKLSSHSPHFFS